MVKAIWPAYSFEHRVAVFFVLVALALGIAAFVNAPLSFYGSFALFHVLDSHHLFASRGRAIDMALQLPVLLATQLTDSLPVLRLVFCASYATIPLVGLAVSWLVCRSRRPNLFIWPAISICLIGLPGQFSFASEALMAVSLLWPALLAVLVRPSSKVLALVAITSLAAVCAHPNAAGVLGFAVLVAIFSAVQWSESRKTEIRFAIFLGVLLVVRVLIPLDHYERHLLGLPVLWMSLEDSVLGWPLAGATFTILAALSLLLPSRNSPWAVPVSALSIAGAAFVAWAIDPANWTKFDDYRFWEPAFSMLLMAGATVDAWWLRPVNEPSSNAVRGNLLALVGGIFLAVVSIMSFVWSRASSRLVGELAGSDRGCISFKDVAAVKDTALDQWSLGLYAIELQDRKPKTLLLKHNLSCRMFAHTGDAILTENPAKIYVKRRDEGWFDLDDAHKRARRSWIAKPPAAE